jgi:hypothetical protein
MHSRKCRFVSLLKLLLHYLTFAEKEHKAYERGEVRKEIAKLPATRLSTSKERVSQQLDELKEGLLKHQLLGKAFLGVLC